MISLDLPSLNNGHLSCEALFYGLCGSFVLLCDVNVMLRMMCHYFSYSGSDVQAQQNVSKGMKQSAQDATSYMAKGLAYAR